MVTAEVAPYAKTGGLGEVMGALPKALHRQGHDVRVFTPLHGKIDRKKFAFVPIGRPGVLTLGDLKTPIQFHASILSQEVPIYFLDNQEYFGKSKQIYDSEHGNLRYALFNHAVFKLLETLDWVPDVIHCQDWHTGLLPNIVQYLPSTSQYAQIATVQTIHNAAFVSSTSKAITVNDPGNGRVPKEPEDIYKLNFLKRGVKYADIVTTVSQQYGKELLFENRSTVLGPILNSKAERFFGIRNGVDYGLFNPHYDQNIPVNYDVDILHRKLDNKRSLQHQMDLPIDDKIPMFGMNSRITEQKGFDLLFEKFDEIMATGAQLVIVGTGHGRFMKIMSRLMKKYPEQFAFRPYSEQLGSMVYAGADIFLMPSLFEPAGLGQLVSLRYGTVPVVRRTGGLADTITDYTTHQRSGNGFVFDEYTGEALVEAIRRALSVYRRRERWQALQSKGMRQSYSWEDPAKKYIRVYRAAIKQHLEQPWHIKSQWNLPTL